MNVRTILISLTVMLSFGPVSAKVDEIDLGYNAPPPVTAPQETTSLPETKDPFYAPEPDPKPEPPTCATPRDGQDSKDEGDRVMCTNSAPAPSESNPK